MKTVQSFILFATALLCLGSPFAVGADYSIDDDNVIDMTHEDSQSWDVNGVLRVGDTGTGTLNITDGGQVASYFGYIGYYAGSKGMVNVTGKNSDTEECSIWNNSDIIVVGREGVGTLNITGGGRVSDFSGSIGHGVGSEGTVNVEKGSVWTNGGDLNIGYAGTGTLNITDGGQVSNVDECYIGFSRGAKGKVTVTGKDSTWINGGRIFIGNGNGCTGMLNIENGGWVTNGEGIVGNLANSNGTVTVTGKDSVWINKENLTVGNEGNGTLNIKDGGLVEVTKGYGQSSSGTLNFTLGELFADTILRVAGNLYLDTNTTVIFDFDFDKLVPTGKDSVFVGMFWDGTENVIDKNQFDFGDWESFNFVNWGKEIVFVNDESGGQAGVRFFRTGDDPEPPSGTPEPATLLMLGLGLGAIPFARRLRKK